MKSHRMKYIYFFFSFITVCFLIILAFLCDIFVFAAYIYSEWGLEMYERMIVVLLFYVFAVLVRGVIYTAILRILRIKHEIYYLIILSVPIISTENFIKDFVIGFNEVQRLERGIGEYTVFTKILFEILYEKNIPDIAIYISGIIICEVSRILPIYFIKKRGEIS